MEREEVVGVGIVSVDRFDHEISLAQGKPLCPFLLWMQPTISGAVQSTPSPDTSAVFKTKNSSRGPSYPDAVARFSHHLQSRTRNAFYCVSSPMVERLFFNTYPVTQMVQVYIHFKTVRKIRPRTTNIKLCQKAPPFVIGPKFAGPFIHCHGW